MLKYFLQLISFAVLVVVSHTQSRFKEKPSDPLIAGVSDTIILPWVYETNFTMTFIKWFRVNADNTPISTYMMYLASSNPPVSILNSKASFNGSARMVLSNLLLSDEGWIACTVDFSNGETLWSRTYLTVGTRPHSTSLPSQNIGIENQNISIECTSIAKPQPRITWYDKVNSEIVNTDHYRIQSIVMETVALEVKVKSTLSIIGLKLSDAGTIKCKSSNDLLSDIAETTLTVYYKPINTKLQLQFTNRLQGSSNAITCTTDAVPNTVYYGIYHESKLLSNTTSGIYSIQSVKNYDEGLYKCIPRNWVGQGNEATETLNVEVVPEIFDSSPAIMTVTENDLVQIICNFNADPNPSVSWQKYDGGNTNSLNVNTTILLQNSTLFQIITVVKITKAQRSDYGSYLCRAGNTVGEVSKNITLVVNYPPAITFHTIAQPSFFINETGSDTIVCESRGFPQPIIKWYRDSVEIQDGGRHTILNSIKSEGKNFVEVRSTIILSLVTKDDAGLFKCEASNAAGIVNVNSTLNVYFKPEITAFMSADSYVNVGAGLSLSCSAKAIESSKISWYKNNIILVSGNGSIKIVEVTVHPHSSSFLTINPITNADSNSIFQCIARNSQGEDSRSTRVSVYFGPSFTEFPPPNIITSENFVNYQIMCTMQANPKPVIKWMKGNQIVLGNSADSRYVIDERIITQTASVTVVQSILEIKSVIREDYGIWTCHGSNTIYGGVYSEAKNTTLLTVTYDPRFEFIPPSNFEVNITDTIIFICRVKASPKPYVWWVLPTNINSDNRFSYSTTIIADTTQFGSVEAKLTIVDVKKTDHGYYTCVTNNTIRSDSRKSQLIVQYKPTVTIDFNEVVHTVAEDSIKSIEIIVDANPLSSAQIEWSVMYINNTSYQPITNNIEVVQIAVIQYFENKYKSRLLFPGGIKRTNQAWYKVKVTNLLGTVEKKTYLVVEWKPQQENLFSGSQDLFSGQTYSFICRYYSNPSNVIDWYKNDVKISHIQYTTEKMFTNTSITLTQSTLSILNAQASDRANYSCQASNAIGSAKQTKFLNVLYPPILQAVSTSLLVDETKPLTLSCKSNSNPPVTQYIWMKNGQKLNSNFENYAILSVSGESSGNYSCMPVNSIGNGSTVTYYVSIRVSPTFTQTSRCSKMNSTQKYFLCTCAGTGWPEPTIYWTKYPSSTIIRNGSLLNLTVSEVNDGTYYCYLKNEKDTVSSTVQINFFVPPFGEWSSWEDCNVTCGDGFQKRQRICNLPPCNAEDLIASQSCKGPCAAQSPDDENSWMYALYAIVPCVVLLIVLAVIWISRLNRSYKDVPILIPINRSISHPPEMPKSSVIETTNLGNWDETLSEQNHLNSTQNPMIGGNGKVQSIRFLDSSQNPSFVSLSNVMDSSMSGKINKYYKGGDTVSTSNIYESLPISKSSDLKIGPEFFKHPSNAIPLSKLSEFPQEETIEPIISVIGEPRTEPKPIPESIPDIRIILDSHKPTGQNEHLFPHEQ